MRVAAHSADERAIDFHRVRLQPMQIAERRIAGPEVVQAFHSTPRPCIRRKRRFRGPDGR